ncbi:hypothetical protein AB3X96_39825 [Paraburkholderia sp. BR13439]|uniref:hypothetical protein n=1 Tax=Paraburkholderia sp. BR13439 TaxID=3236996 RepID=UPI0034CDA02C
MPPIDSRHGAQNCFALSNGASRRGAKALNCGSNHRTFGVRAEQNIEAFVARNGDFLMGSHRERSAADSQKSMIVPMAGG